MRWNALESKRNESRTGKLQQRAAQRRKSRRKRSKRKVSDCKLEIWLSSLSSRNTSRGDDGSHGRGGAAAWSSKYLARHPGWARAAVWCKRGLRVWLALHHAEYSKSTSRQCHFNIHYPHSSLLFYISIVLNFINDRPFCSLCFFTTDNS